MDPVTSWTFDGREISLLPGTFQQPNCFFVEGADRRIKVEPTRYDSSRAKTLIEMFHQTIEENLKRQTHRDSCFFPVWSMRAHNAPELEIALFGHLDTTVNNSNNLEARVAWMRWGVHNTSTGDEQFLDETGSLASIFIENAPQTNRPHIVPGVYKNGMPILDKDRNIVMKPDRYHNAMENYAKRFRVDVTREGSRVQAVALHYVSLLDKDVFLDETHWAVTFVSTRTSTPIPSYLSRFFEGRFAGHAMLACEGIRGGEPFLEYIHLTQTPQDPLPNLGRDQAQIEIGTAERFISEKNPPLNSTYDAVKGTTWARSKDLVENMLRVVEQGRNTPVPFSLYRNCLVEWWALWGNLCLACCQPPIVFLTAYCSTFVFHCPSLGLCCFTCCNPALFSSYYINGLHLQQRRVIEDLVRERVEGRGSLTCLHWAAKITPHSGIFLRLHNNFRTPLEMIDMIQSNPPEYVSQEINSEPSDSTPFFNQVMERRLQRILSAPNVSVPCWPLSLFPSCLNMGQDPYSLFVPVALAYPDTHPTEVEEMVSFRRIETIKHFRWGQGTCCFICL